MAAEYLPRIADELLEKRLSYAGAVLIRSAKWCGKTRTAEQQAKSALYLQDPDTRASNLELAETKPSILLRGDKPRLIDEWQDAPQLWDAARFAINRAYGHGHYIFTGSATPGKRPSHSGTGRFSFLTMYPMALSESGESTGEVSLSELFDAPADLKRMRLSITQRKSELSRTTFGEYVGALRRLYVFDDLEAWRPSLRARSRVSATPTRHFVDPSLAVTALGATPDMLLADMPTLGLLFESLCVRDLRAYLSTMGGELYHYHDMTGLEADAVAVVPDGRWGAFEVKTSPRAVDDGAAALLKLASKVDESVGRMAFLAVVTASGYAYRRGDGVYVIPISCLAPQQARPLLHGQGPRGGPLVFRSQNLGTVPWFWPLGLRYHLT